MIPLPSPAIVQAEQRAEIASTKPNPRSHGPARIPQAGGIVPAPSPGARADAALRRMTAEEKFAWMSGPMAIPPAGKPKPAGAIGSAGYFPGVPRLGIPAQQQTDASLGIGNLNDVRPGDSATALPSSLLLGATFDPAIARETGALVGAEAHAKGFNVVLGGGANLLREPRGGRNFEYISEDPLLTGMIVGGSIAGIQSRHVVSTIKHFAVNAEETGRVMVDSRLGEPALRESDLLAFEIGIEQGRPGAVMPGYNLVNGDWASESAFLLSRVLKGDWRYPGWVMSDWGATHSTVKAALAGLDVQSGANLDSEPFFAAPLRDAIARGIVPQARVDDSVRRQLRSLFAVGAIDDPARPGGPIDYDAHRRIVQRAAEAGLVLLENRGGALPLAKGAKRLLVIGAHADTGVLSGGGSSSVTPTGSLELEGASLPGLNAKRVYQPGAPLDAIRREAGAHEVRYLDGKNPAASVRAAAEADAVIVFAEQWRVESRDVQSLALPDGQDAMISAVAAANPKTIVVLETGGAVAMPWREQVAGVVLAFYPGSGGADAIAGVLFGRVNPSGRLPYTIPASERQLPRPAQIDPKNVVSNPGQPLTKPPVPIDYNIEGADVGYRWYTRTGQTPLYPFGYGLSYTRFAYSNLRVRSASPERIAVSVDVTNQGGGKGAEVVQVYASRPGDCDYQPRLVGFAKLALAPGETRAASILLEPRLLARVRGSAWTIAEGAYRIDVRRDASRPVLGETIRLPAWSRPLAHDAVD